MSLLLIFDVESPDNIKVNGDPINVQDFNDSLSMNLVGTTSRSTFVPPGLVYYSPDNSIVVFERFPFIQNISYYNFPKSEVPLESSPYVYSLPLPWQYYIGHFHPNGDLEHLSVYLASSQSIIKKSSMIENGFSLIPKDGSSLHKLPLPNVYSNNTFCLDHLVDLGPCSDMPGLINRMFSAVWSTNFNRDLLDAINDTASHFDNSSDPKMFLKNWQKLSLYQVVNNISDYFKPEITSYQISPIKQGSISLINTMASLAF